MEHNELTIEIEQDEYPDSPRDWDNLGTMVCFHSRYNIGDKHDYQEADFSSWDELEEQLVKDGARVVKPLYLYDHSVLSISTGSFHGRAQHAEWDSGQVGFIAAFSKDIEAFVGWKRLNPKRRKRIDEMLESEVEVYNQYLLGDVWGYTVESPDGEVLDSCWGFYGRGLCEHEAQLAASVLSEERSMA